MELSKLLKLKVDTAPFKKDDGKDTISSSGIINALDRYSKATHALKAAQRALPDHILNITAITEKYESMLAPTLATSALMAAQQALPDHILNITAITEKYESMLAPTMATSALMAAQQALPDHILNITAITEKYESMLAPTMATSALMAAQQALPDHILNITAIAEKYEKMLAPTLATSALMAAQQALPDHILNITAIAEKYEKMLAPTLETSALMAVQQAVSDRFDILTSLAERYSSMLVPSTSISDLLASQLRINSRLEMMPSLAHSSIYGAADDYLKNLSFDELKSITATAQIFINSAPGAAFIAQNTSTLNEVEPDAYTKLQEFRNNNKYIKQFRELPIIVQLIILYFVVSIIKPIIDDTLKTETLELFNRAGEMISKQLHPNAYMKKIITNEHAAVIWGNLNDFRIITAENVRLRENPSMKGEVKGNLKKYCVVAILDKSDRSWLYVQVLLDGEKIDGWVNRTYTKSLKN